LQHKNAATVIKAQKSVMQLKQLSILLFLKMINLCTTYIPDMRFKHPCAILISGTTGVGKSHFVKLIIECGGTDVVYDNIFYFTPRMNKLDIVPAESQEIFYCQGLPTETFVKERIKHDGSKNLIVIDDQWQKCVKDDYINALLTTERRHLNEDSGVSIILISQNYYQKGEHSITLRYEFLIERNNLNFKKLYV
jgi:hypothetical protein